jgi:DNA repair exonuclease SbcCD nuclease subunit
MDKLLLISDTHLGLQNSSDLWLNVTLNLFKEVVDTCLRKDISTILHLGDFFDEKKSTNQKTLSYAYAIADVIQPLYMTIITGNHDIYHKEKIHPSSLKCFMYHKDINVITETQLDNEFTLVPWGCNISSKGKFCFGHFDINSFPMNNTSYCNNSNLNIDDFKQYEHVYSGHFHTPSNKGNITYIGSTFQQTFNDCGSSRGYYIFDNGDLEFIEYKEAPKFIKLHTEEKISNVEGNIVKLIYDKDYGTNQNTKILEEVEKMGPLKLLPNFTNISNDEEYSTDEELFTSIKHSDIIGEWIKCDKNIPVNIDKRVLQRMMEKMIDE